jgi:hypothetical protein
LTTKKRPLAMPRKGPFPCHHEIGHPAVRAGEKRLDLRFASLELVGDRLEGRRAVRAAAADAGRDHMALRADLLGALEAIGDVARLRRRDGEHGR